jgi:CBS domain containing-hemolysin-like protein
MSPVSLLSIASVPIDGSFLSPGWGLLVGLVLVFINGFFVAAEFALVKVRPTQLQPHVAARRPGSKLAQSMVARLDAYLSACQLGITLASLALGWLGEPAFAWVVEPVVRLFPGTTDATVHKASIAVAFLVITILHIVLGEMAPKSLAIRKPVRTSLWISAPLWLFFTVSYPVIWLLNESSNLLLRLVGIEGRRTAAPAAAESPYALLAGSSSAYESPAYERARSARPSSLARHGAPWRHGVLSPLDPAVRRRAPSGARTIPNPSATK